MGMQYNIQPGAQKKAIRWWNRKYGIASHNLALLEKCIKCSDLELENEMVYMKICAT